jgi:3-oxoacyl-[acyl-carrier-protein] synthase-3
MNTTIQHVAIRGVVGAVPGDPFPIASLPSRLTDDELRNLRVSVGLDRLYRCVKGQTAGDLCLAAARKVIQDLHWAPASIDGVFMVTQTPDHLMPATACIIHRELGLKSQCLAFDIGMGCSGYVYGLWTASQFIATGSCKRVLLLAGDTISRLLSPNDNSVSVLFGDAGSATALEFESGASPIAFVGGSDGSGAADLIVPAGGFRLPLEEGDRTVPESDCRSSADLYMDGVSVLNFVLKRIPTLLNETLVERGWEARDVELLLMHQANAFILRNLAKRLKMSDRLSLNINKYGNTSMASLPLLIADEVSERLMSSTKVKTVMAGFGVGYSWAAAATEICNLQSAGVVQVMPDKEDACTIL